MMDELAMSSVIRAQNIQFSTFYQFAKSGKIVKISVLVSIL